MKTHRIAVVPGDGVGPEVVAEGLRVLRAAAGRFGFAVELTEFPHGTEHWLATGEVLPDEVLERIAAHDAILLGAVGDPRAPVGELERGIIGRLRWDLDLYVNLRPVELMDERFCPLKGKGPDDVDFVVVRENTEDAYVTSPEFHDRNSPQEVAVQPMRYTRRGTERIVRYAFELARTRPGKRLTLVDKANAIRAQDLWTRVFAEVGEEYPDVERDHLYVDAACVRMVEAPESFDTVVTTNLFGDVLTDLGAALQGGMGMAASANLHPGRLGLFESVHGSFPQAAGKDLANPIATILAVAMMLDWLGEGAAGAAVREAVRTALTAGPIRSLELGAHGTREIGEAVLDALAGQVTAG